MSLHFSYSVVDLSHNRLEDTAAVGVFTAMKKLVSGLVKVVTHVYSESVDFTYTECADHDGQ